MARHQQYVKENVEEVEDAPKDPWWYGIKEPGSAFQIVAAALLAIGIGLAVTLTRDVPEAAIVLTMIPGTLWLRALKAVVLPLIICSMILAVQKLKEMATGGAMLAKYTIGYYVLTTVLAVIHSEIAVALGWRRLLNVASPEALRVSEEDQAEIDAQKSIKIHEIVEDMFESLVPANVVDSLATDGLLAVLVTSVVVGYLIKGPNSSLLRGVVELERLIMTVITFLIKCAPIGVFFLILPNVFKFDVAAVGRNFGVLVGSAVGGMSFHLFVVIPIIFLVITKKNPWSYWAKCSPAWITAWGTSSSAATLSVTMRCAHKRGIPLTISKFALPLGALVNMDGTAIYFPIVVVFLAATQGITLNVPNYIIIVMLSSLSAIGTTPIPSSSLVLSVMIANTVHVPITGMYSVVVAIDWFLDRFRTVLNVSGDLYAAAIITKLSGIRDPDDMSVLPADKEVGPNRV